MKKYKALLTRSYIVTIHAQNEHQACECAEFYLGDCPDLSKSKDRKEQKFKIEEVEMTFNDSSEAKEII